MFRNLHRISAYSSLELGYVCEDAERKDVRSFTARFYLSVVAKSEKKKIPSWDL